MPPPLPPTDIDKLERMIAAQDRYQNLLITMEAAAEKHAQASLRRHQLALELIDARTKAGTIAADAAATERSAEIINIGIAEAAISNLTEARQKHDQEVAEGGRIAKQYGDLLFGLSSTFGGLYQKYIPKTTTEFASLAVELRRNVFSLQGFVNIGLATAGGLLDMALAADESYSAFRKTTGAGMQYKNIMVDVRNANRAAGVTYKESGEALSSLYRNMSVFTETSDASKRSLINTVTLMGELGVSSALTTRVMDQATRTLGMNVVETNALTRSLKDVAISLGKDIQDVVRDFAAAVPKLAFYGKHMVEIFKELEKQSKATGLSVDQILGLVGEQFDTFEDASTAVGKLNAILGGPYLNSIDMVNASEAERMELLKGAADAAGIIFSDLNKYEKKMYASAMGTDVDTLSRAMRNLSAAEQLEIRQQETLAKLAIDTKSVMDELSNAVRNLIVDNKDIFDTIVDLIRGFSKLLQSLDAGTKKWIVYAGLAAGVAGALGYVVIGLKALGVGALYTKIAGAIGILRTALMGLTIAWNLSPFVLISVVVALAAAWAYYIYKMNKAGYGWQEMLKNVGATLLVMTGPLGQIIMLIGQFNRRMQQGMDKWTAFKTALGDVWYLGTMGIGQKERRIFEEATPTPVGDWRGSGIIVTPTGQVIQPQEEDEIIAAKPNGPFSRMMGDYNRAASDVAGSAAELLAKSPLGAFKRGMLMGTWAPILESVVTDPIVAAIKGSSRDRGGDTNVVVKIGEKELNQQMIEVLDSVEAMERIGPFPSR